MTEQNEMTKNGAHTVLDKRYQLLQCLRHDERGQVWLGTDLGFERKVIVKLLPLHRRHAPTHAEILRALKPVLWWNQPHILPLDNVGHCMEDGEVMLYLVLPYMRGGTLADRLNHRRERLMKPSPPKRCSSAVMWNPSSLAFFSNDDLQETFAYLRQVAQALDYAHSQGVLHGHLTPANLFLNDKGWLLLADLGIEHTLVGSEQAARMQARMTSHEYLAPEQVQGRTEMASDLYSLARLAYQLLCQPATEQLDPSLPDTCKNIFARGLAHDPADRFPSACAFVEELERPFGFRWGGMVEHALQEHIRSCLAMLHARVELTLADQHFILQLEQQAPMSAAQAIAAVDLLRSHARDLATFRLKVPAQADLQAFFPWNKPMRKMSPGEDDVRGAIFTSVLLLLWQQQLEREDVLLARELALQGSISPAQAVVVTEILHSYKETLAAYSLKIPEKNALWSWALKEEEALGAQARAQFLAEVEALPLLRSDTPASVPRVCLERGCRLVAHLDERHYRALWHLEQRQKEDAMLVYDALRNFPEVVYAPEVRDLLRPPAKIYDILLRKVGEARKCFELIQYDGYVVR